MLRTTTNFNLLPQTDSNTSTSPVAYQVMNKFRRSQSTRWASCDDVHLSPDKGCLAKAAAGYQTTQDDETATAGRHLVAHVHIELGLVGDVA
eukprot:361174-Chlamydomonas_euryale.AAC.3